MQEANKSNVIDLRVVFKRIWSERRLFYKVLPIVFVLSCIYIFSLPRYYRTDAKLAPEIESSGQSGTLGSLASSLGFDISEMQTSDAITPMLYPDLMEDNGFVSALLDIRVKSKDGEIDTTYHDYLKYFQQRAWWSYPIAWLKSLLPKKKDEGGTGGAYDPYYISLDEEGIYNLIRGNISISIDKKVGVITIQSQDQDPLICRTITDSVKSKLQVYITDYRTNKARTDYEYYKALTDSAKMEYEAARQLYAKMSDANTNLTLKTVTSKLENLENDMQIKFNAYNTLNTQLQAAKAKVQERTPAFTAIKGATVPTKPAGPKRMIFVGAMLLLASTCVGVYILIDILKP